MKELEQLTREVEQLRAKVKEASRAERDVSRLIEWLDELVDETEDYRNLPWYHRKKLAQSHSFFFKGQTRQGREIAKRFLRWKVSRRSAAEVEEEADQLLKEIGTATRGKAAELQEEQWQAAVAKFGDSEDLGNQPELADVDLVVLDVTGRSEDLRKTLETGRIDRSRFRSSHLLTAWQPETDFEMETEVVEDGVFPLFQRLDERIAASNAEYTCVLMSGTVLMDRFALPENWKEYDFILPRAIDLSTGEPTPVWDRLERIKNSLFPLFPSCFLARNRWLREDASSFQHFLAYRPWHLWLQALASKAGPLQLTEPSLIISSPQEPNLSAGNRAWLETTNPEPIPELRGTQEEWDILRHDLILRVIDANLSFFQEYVGYYAAVTQTGIRR